MNTYVVSMTLSMLRGLLTPKESVSLFLQTTEMVFTNSPCERYQIEALLSAQELEYACMAAIIFAKMHPTSAPLFEALHTLTSRVDSHPAREYYLSRLVLAYEHMEPPDVQH